MAIRNVAVGGTALPLIVAGQNLQAGHLCARVTLQRKPANTGKIYIGLPGTNNTGSAVTSTAYDIYLDASNPSYTVGMGQTNGNGTDLSSIWINADNSGEGVSFAVEQA